MDTTNSCVKVKLEYTVRLSRRIYFPLLINMDALKSSVFVASKSQHWKGIIRDYGPDRVHAHIQYSKWEGMLGYTSILNYLYDRSHYPLPDEPQGWVLSLLLGPEVFILMKLPKTTLNRM